MHVCVCLCACMPVCVHAHVCVCVGGGGGAYVQCFQPHMYYRRIQSIKYKNAFANFVIIHI